MISPTPQDFEKARRSLEVLCTDRECHPNSGRFYDKAQLEIAFARALADERERVETGSGIFCPCIKKIESLQSEKSLLEKRVAELELHGQHSVTESAIKDRRNAVDRIKALEAELSNRKKNQELVEADNDKLKRAMEITSNTDEVEKLQAENERLKAEVVSRTKEIELLEKIGRYQPHVVETLESRLAEAVRVLKIYAPDKCDNCDGEGLIESDGLNGSMMEFMCPCKVAREFLSSPTTSKALEIARVKDAVIEAARKLCDDFNPLGKPLGKFTPLKEKDWINVMKLIMAVEALHALTSEEGNNV